MKRGRLFECCLAGLGVSLVVGCSPGLHISIREDGTTDDYERVRSQICALPLYAEGMGAAFPISKRNAISAAHLFWDERKDSKLDRGQLDCIVAAVAGRPMLANMPHIVARLSDLPAEKDWVVLHGTADRFDANSFDGSVTLKRGDRVYLAGFPNELGSAIRETLIKHVQREPVVVAGQVIAPSLSRRAKGLVDVAIPTPKGNGHGFSGGPAAILDENGQLRIWGVIVRGAWQRSPWPGLPRSFVLRVARLSQEEVDRAAKIRLLGPSEAAHPSATTTPTARDAQETAP